MIEVRELIDTEVEAVLGGVFDFGNTVAQANNHLKRDVVLNRRARQPVSMRVPA